tara:strand:+ start:6203 stop:6514 length:312 start_codon:yes stop_codon:yes gene_type:complete
MTIEKNKSYLKKNIKQYRKIIEDLKNKELSQIYNENIFNSILEDNIYSYTVYYKYYKYTLIKNYINKYNKYINLEKKKIKVVYCLNKINLIGDLIELIVKKIC